MTKAMLIREFMSYNVELASTYIQSLEIENASNTFSLSNEIKFDVGDKHNKYLLYMQFFAWNYNGCSVAPLLDYANNEIFHELPKLQDYFII